MSHRTNISHGPLHGNSAQLGRPFEDVCAWPSCWVETHPALPLCRRHALKTYKVMREEYEELVGTVFPKPDTSDMPEREDTSLVYYLRLGPHTVKIGTTKNLTQRICHLRTDMDYLMAVEPGSLELEKRRHGEFAPERLGRREDFRLTPRLHEHIDKLASVPANQELLAKHAIRPVR